MSAAWALEMMWHDICFAHWRAGAEALANRLPPNVEIDCFDGTAWVSVVPFRMTGVHARYAPTRKSSHAVCRRKSRLTASTARRGSQSCHFA